MRARSRVFVCVYVNHDEKVAENRAESAPKSVTRMKNNRVERHAIDVRIGDSASRGRSGRRNVRRGRDLRYDSENYESNLWCQFNATIIVNHAAAVAERSRRTHRPSLHPFRRRRSTACHAVSSFVTPLASPLRRVLFGADLLLARCRLVVQLAVRDRALREFRNVLQK